MAWGTATDMYGSPPSLQPTSAAVGQVGSAEPADPTPGVRTAPAPSAGGLFSQPTFWLIALLAAVVGLVSFSVKVG